MFLQYQADILAEAEKLGAEEGEAAQDKRLSEDSEEAQQLPAYLLSYNEDYFNQLFQLLSLNNDVISPKVWDLLLSMPTSKTLLENLHSVALGAQVTGQEKCYL